MGRKRVGVTQGMSGWFAVLYDDDGPIQTGIGRYQTRNEARLEALSWALASGIELEPMPVPDPPCPTPPQEEG